MVHACRAREPAAQATPDVAVSHDLEAGITAEELLLPRKWKVVLVTLRMMLDMRPEIEQMLRVRMPIASPFMRS